MSRAAAAERAEPSPWRLAGRLALWTPRRYFGFGALWALRAIVPLVSGFALKEAFDAVSASPAAASAGSGRALWYVAAFFAAEALRTVFVAVAIVGWAYWWEGSNTIVRGNVLHSVLSAPGPAADRVPHSPGEAVGRLRDDSRDLVVLADGWVDRLLAPGEDADALVARRPVSFTPVQRKPASAAPDTATATAAAAGAAAAALAPGDQLDVFAAHRLRARAPGAARGIDTVDLRLARGSFTVVTGAVGAGKTTLLRAILGLVPSESGTITWNGEVVLDPGSFMVPPRVAYVAQVARLQSDTLAENLLLGWPAADDQLAQALHLAALERDVADMPAGLATMVGPRGVRLSGGQLQRATTARALVRQPELLVVDDLSSALDVDTEAELWARLAAGGPATCLVVSHRRAALQRADEVIVLAGGRVAARGPLIELLERSPEMRRLWREEASRLAEGELTG